MSERHIDFAGLKFQEHLNVFLVVFINEYFENFTNNNKLLFCQLSKLLKSYVSSQGSYIF
ncbi:hypothetical protein FKN08_24450 [Vibrio sp. 1-2 (7-a)]|uniref:Uncharacterized protein n=1 Tax=Vibrio diabolicus TaxID=50719 RepID=A0ABM6SB60_9VIBR|nr:hypothetical protein AL468_09585 [Vibrio diabolicus]NNN59243.1 hypothetical protein [Vibrio sp. 1-2 (7-a)]